MSIFLYFYHEKKLTYDIIKYYNYYFLFNVILESVNKELIDIKEILNNNFLNNIQKIQEVFLQTKHILKENIANYLENKIDNIIVEIPNTSNDISYKPLYCDENNCNNINTNLINYFNYNIHKYLDFNNITKIINNNDIIHISKFNEFKNNGPYRVSMSTNIGCKNLYGQTCF